MVGFLMFLVILGVDFVFEVVLLFLVMSGFVDDLGGVELSFLFVFKMILFVLMEDDEEGGLLFLFFFFSFICILLFGMVVDLLELDVLLEFGVFFYLIYVGGFLFVLGLVFLEFLDSLLEWFILFFLEILEDVVVLFKSSLFLLLMISLFSFLLLMMVVFLVLGDVEVNVLVEYLLEILLFLNVN